MSDGTKVDLPKVAQLLDNRWKVTLFKNDIGSYTARGMRRSRRDRPARVVVTDDFTPEQALTRLAYKVLGETL